MYNETDNISHIHLKLKCQKKKVIFYSTNIEIESVEEF